MNFKKPVLTAALLAAVSVTSGCELLQPQETIDPVTGEVTIIPVTPPTPAEQPRTGGGGNRGGGGGGGW